MARQDALSSATTLELMIGDYLDWHALRCSARRHCRDVKRELLRFAVTVGTDVPIAQVTREHCTAFLCGFQERDCKPNTLKAYHRIHDAFFHWCVEDEQLDASPTWSYHCRLIWLCRLSRNQSSFYSSVAHPCGLQ